ncbi:MAG TPA: flavohemoglobin expression-modulating QEGLA motif protein [Parapedobacter sp.]|uniref:flavohemoglobin expression-modulating QEGLA motif protein n=1 Tax=Parapedobacter sp. TaxID=1958893 RepID=UPI002B748D85|nr:flavohemoglobin expression-modulating QEGLA motif protein [Parapedobacter sp.]HWK59318.1 flavohemoglobin expression-modulating QEGLA motif protein [Parapedobacter sp.]
MVTDTKKLMGRIRAKLKKGIPLRMELPCGGELHIDRPVPYLLVYRVPPNGEDAFTSTLGKTESAYLVAPDTSECPATPIVREIAEMMADQFGGFMLLEVWLSEQAGAPTFTIHLGQKSALEVAEKLQSELQAIHLQQLPGIDVELVKGKKLPTPPYYGQLFNAEEARKREIIAIGLAITPVYMNEQTGAPYPLFLRALRESFGKALRKSFFEFVRMKTSYSAAHFEMLGTTELHDGVWDIDERLAEYSNLFDFLLLVTPINAQDAWHRFAKSKYQSNPVFHYRPMPIDPELIKRKLYNLPIEDISDPTIAYLFRDKRKEVDRMLNMLSDREKPDFVYSSQQLFGNIEEDLLETARAILVASEQPRQEAEEGEMIDADAFAALAKVELSYLKQQYDAVSTAVRVRDDVEGVMVSRGTLNISSRYRISKARAFALLQHEVGTHVATYYNGKAQPFRLFYVGVPGYEQLQEGLAVLSEYITGGLTNNRMRILAARVVAVHHMLAGNSFADTFDMLTDKYGFKHEAAFHVTMRVYRGGGLTKDAVYLKGLLNVIEYIKQGKDIEQLLVGKIRQDYLPIIEELMHRQLLKPSPLRPKFLEKPYIDKIDEIKKEGSVFRMIG